MGTNSNDGRQQKTKSGIFTRLKERIWRKRGEVFSIGLTLTFTFFGFLLSVGDDFFSQYDYKHKKIYHNILPKENSEDRVVDFNDIKKDSEKYAPKYYFILDVSGSMPNKSVKIDDITTEQIKVINGSGYAPHNEGYIFIDDNGGKISERRKLQALIMSTLIKLYDSAKENLYVILFSSFPEQLADDKSIRDKLTQIYNRKFDGNNTNFEVCFEFLKKKVLKSVGPSDKFKRRECHLIIFSDYINDPYKTSEEKEKAEQKLQKAVRDFISDVREKNLDLRLHYQEISDDKSGKKTLLLQSLLNEIPSSKVAVFNGDSGIVSPIISGKPIPFYYSNSVFEDSLTTSIKFDSLKCEKELSFGLNCSPTEYNNLKQEYYLIKGSNIIHLSDNLQSRIIEPTDKITLMIKGYIPIPYKSPDIVIQDKDEGIKYIVPVAFYREFPEAGVWILSIIISLIVLLLLIIIWEIYRWIVKRHSLSNNNHFKKNKQYPHNRHRGGNQRRKFNRFFHFNIGALKHVENHENITYNL